MELANSKDNSANADRGLPDILAAMHAFQKGDKSSFDRLEALLWKAVYLRACKMGLAHCDAEEVAQKVLVRIYLYAGGAVFNHVPQLWRWVYTIATREVYKHWKRRRPELVSDRLEVLASSQAANLGDDPADQAAAAEAVADVGDCIGRLADDERLHLLGPLVQGITFRQAASVHGLSLGQFKHRYEKALQKVRNCMKAKGHF